MLSPLSELFVVGYPPHGVSQPKRNHLIVMQGRSGRCSQRRGLTPLINRRSIEIEIEIVYNMYRMRRLLSLGPPNNAIHETYKSGLEC
jgi:hypothetical protein